MSKTNQPLTTISFLRRIALITIIFIMVAFISQPGNQCSASSNLIGFQIAKPTISLLSIIESQRKEAQNLLKDAEVFEVNTIITIKEVNAGVIDKEGLNVISGFASYKDNIKFVRSGTHAKYGNKVEEQQMDLIGFLIGSCPEGVVDTNGPRCDAETGKPEEFIFHLPLKNLKLDILDILCVLREQRVESKNLVSTSAETVTLSITTLGRAKTVSMTSSPMSHIYG